MTRNPRRNKPLSLEQLEGRLVLSGAPPVGLGIDVSDFEPYLMAGKSPDSPSKRVDPNTAASRFGGVVGLLLDPDPDNPGSVLCSGSAITRQHILTAAHCVDLNADGLSDIAPENTTVIVNFTGDASHTYSGSKIAIHPDWTGFANPAVTDDLAIIALDGRLPEEVPTYDIVRDSDSVLPGTVVTMVGYGMSNHGQIGAVRESGLAPGTITPSPTVKRTGQNVMDAFLLDDEGAGATELFIMDFDHPTGNGRGKGYNPLGGLTLGNDIESALAAGDSGGPSFVEVDGVLRLVGVNTAGSANSFSKLTRFGSLSGAQFVPTYAGWIDGVTGGGESDSIVSEASGSDSWAGSFSPVALESTDKSLGNPDVQLLQPDRPIETAKKARAQDEPLNADQLLIAAGAGTHVQEESNERIDALEELLATWHVREW